MSAEFTPSPILQVENVNAYFSGFHAVKNISLAVPEHQVTALIGPSGCGKSTFIRSLNRLHEETEGATLTGEVRLAGKNIYTPGVDPVEIRRQIGMVFQKANPFPGMSIYENVAVGLTLQGGFSKVEIENRVEKALRSSALWDEVKDKLKKPGTSLSGGQSQRLCIARALAVEPKVILMDEPTSALDPISTARIEELIFELKKQTTVVIVTHNMQQAARVSDFTAFFLMGELIEMGITKTIFTNPKERQTEHYITGRFG
ncbi:MAG: phosphate ABC transporter ATP-binding protein [Xanthomonadaceae bacterium]|nr:phosphate ABC transporter ATP-binding protein [Xanthomonadaceae bacterium]